MKNNNVSAQAIANALAWFERNVCETCTDCTKAHDFSCSGANANKCNAFRVAIHLLRSAKEQKISLETPLGRLEACVGGDPVAYPEIFTYLVRPDGVEIDLVACDVNLEEQAAKAYLYGDTSTEEWTRRHCWSKAEINIDFDQ